MQGKKAKCIGFSLAVVMFLGIIAFAYPVKEISVNQNQESFVLSDESSGYAISELVNAGKSKSAKCKLVEQSAKVFQNLGPIEEERSFGK